VHVGGGVHADSGVPVMMVASVDELVEELAGVSE